jgi:ATP-binding cassette, sub-family E, member 1
MRVHLRALDWQAPPDWQEILAYFRGSELQNYFTKILEDNIKAVIKPQYVDQIPKATRGKGSVGVLIDAKDERKVKDLVCEALDLSPVLERNPEELSGGELQRFAIAIVCIRDANVYVGVVCSLVL